MAAFHNKDLFTSRGTVPDFSLFIVLHRAMSTEDDSNTLELVEIGPSDEWPQHLTLQRVQHLSEIFYHQRLWKIAQKSQLLEDIKSNKESSAFWKISYLLEIYNEDEVLVGHNPLHQTPTYCIARTVDSKNNVLAALQNLHNTYEIRVLTLACCEPRLWLSRGSEREVDEARIETTREKISVEWIGNLEKRYESVTFEDVDLDYVEFPSTSLQTYKILRKTKLDIGLQVNVKYHTVHTQSDTYEIALEFQTDQDVDENQPEQTEITNSEEISTDTTTLHRGSIGDHDVSLNYHKSFINMQNRFKKISSIAWHPVKPGYVAVAYTSPRQPIHDESIVSEKPHQRNTIIQKSRKPVNECDIETIDSIFDIISDKKKPHEEQSADEDSASESDSAKDESEDDENDDQSTKKVRDSSSSLIYKNLSSTCEIPAQESSQKSDREFGEHSKGDLRWASDLLKMSKSLPRDDEAIDDSSEDASVVSSPGSETSCSTMKSEPSVKIPVYEDVDGEDVDSIEDELPITDTDSSVLIWSCDNDIIPQLELYNVHDVDVIKFYPLDGNFIAGGSRSGQLILWDIRDDIETWKSRHGQCDQSNLTAEFMENLPHWESDQFKCPLVHPAAISVRNISHVDRITDVEWMHPSLKLSSTGALTKTEPDSRQILTASLDGSIKVWEMQSSHSKEAHKGDSRSLSLQLIYNMIVTNPKLEKYPLSIVAFKILLPSAQYISTSSGNFTFVPESNKKINLSIAMANTIGEVGIIKIVEKKDAFSDTPASKAPENCKHEWWEICHDDSITSLSQNYFFPNIFLSTGGRIFSLWNCDFKYGPIWWKQYAVNITLTGSCFSPYHPGLIYISRSDGKVDVWNVTKQIHLPLLEVKASGFRIEGISIVTPPTAEYQLSIADSNGIFHILKNQYNESWGEDEFKNVDVFFKRAEDCKKQLLQWNKHWKDLSTTSDEYGFQYKPEPKKPAKYDPQRTRSQRISKPSLPIEKLIGFSTVDERPLLEKIADSQEHKKLLQKLLDEYKALPKLTLSQDISTNSEPLSINSIHRIYCT